MIMGKNTFHSLPNVLPNRLHIVLTNNSNDEEIHRIESNKTKNSFVITVKSISEALQCAVADVDTDEYNKHRERKVSIVGGHSVFQHMQRLCRRWHITLVHDIHNYDTRFPEITRQDSSGATHIFDLAFDLRMDREAIRRAGGRIVQQETYPNDEYNPVPYTFFTIEW
jgi:dihydrofolate reductase